MRCGMNEHSQKQAYLYGLSAVLLWSTLATAFKLALRVLDPIQKINQVYGARCILAPISRAESGTTPEATADNNALLARFARPKWPCVMMEPIVKSTDF